MIVIAILAILVALVAGWRTWRRLRFFLHVFQLEGYKQAEYGAWLAERSRPIVLAPSHAVGVVLIFLVLAGGAWWSALLGLLGWLLAFASDGAYSAREKKPLAFTSRMRRQATAAMLLAALPVVAGTIVGLALGIASGTAAFLVGWWLADIAAPFWVMLAGALMKPVEHRVQEGYKRQAREKLSRQTDLTVVGITGSYGKTSTKFAVAEILKQRFNTLATPGSYNTPMGLCLVVNNQLRPDHRVLVLEYGIRFPGDMDELTELVRPEIAILTSVGIAHLESMGTIEAISAEKARLLEALPAGGHAIVNVDDERVAAVADSLPESIIVHRVSVARHPGADLSAHDIAYGRDGARFTVRGRDGQEEAFSTRLLGAHNVLNILLGLATGCIMGMRLRQMVPAVARIEPVEHRLQLRENGGVLVIDDAFNANPVGARNAVDILAEFDGGRRVIVTPGMIELGDRQADENRAFGRHIAQRLTQDGDLVALVGPRLTEPIQQGLRDADYPQERVKVFKSLFDARDFLTPILREGDVVLYENDLPDHYDEAG